MRGLQLRSVERPRSQLGQAFVCGGEGVVPLADTTFPWLPFHALRWAWPAPPCPVTSCPEKAPDWGSFVISPITSLGVGAMGEHPPPRPARAGGAEAGPTRGSDSTFPAISAHPEAARAAAARRHPSLALSLAIGCPCVT
ncbi:guanine nucleotide exchange factor for Rab-3A [Platysternon megacephalum]|uniref:Guanine nucleotide exchange factor for Rab-3A n=1 Tax=Platysternon megacephalum TaxID=55544 RepID=A0A4D9E0J5_9SAUR|nr:guanine nucleotide exchange factor for Rab-3A [Platysternon megacephalum]